MYVFYWRTRPIHAFCALVTSLVVLFRDAPTQFKKVSINSVDCNRCRWCMGLSPDLESSTKREVQPTRCPRSGNVSWLLELCVCVVLIIFLCRYLLNPYIFLPSLALSTSSFENTLLLISLMFACQGNYFLTSSKISVGSIFPSRKILCISTSHVIPHPPITIKHCHVITVISPSH